MTCSVISCANNNWSGAQQKAVSFTCSIKYPEVSACCDALLVFVTKPVERLEVLPANVLGTRCAGQLHGLVCPVPLVTDNFSTHIVLLNQPENPCWLVLQGRLATRPCAEDRVSDSSLL
ncbi:hypothetical protein Q8A67_020064 [Cirrhinus molitorella]|uniref:Uncharacterized protein n=1 Tax=Cirrhinus molitorella TaxID=172907 RepID=A0AA88PB56_9TELE|nr:hypothetical protein Q8A67_020064 [Cirrhinus molitorella]